MSDLFMQPPRPQPRSDQRPLRAVPRYQRRPDEVETPDVEPYRVYVTPGMPFGHHGSPGRMSGKRGGP